VDVGATRAAVGVMGAMRDAVGAKDARVAHGTVGVVGATKVDEAGDDVAWEGQAV
jgi:hypothetical protein